ncbi:CatB-related O-acetyltransferase [Streptococcus loxodontisalivarius]|uniref:Virginiamycin A acetyltransferase n=1 Tax=Streptococcus loxodontisalivarius TaxID=1349415 RepID=A0ABS2PSX6_9STRE|nr:CatB-related O-acetyltransferase [Streptococcus loxodontisalivarius]MBM7642981.1 virginiamycin A acetyltransferase [Streptococcus loxodontisalivarius]
MTANEMIFLKEQVKADNITVGAYTYYAKEREGENFEEDNVLYNIPGHGDLTIGNFCSLANGVQFIMSAANHSIASVSSYPFMLVKEKWRQNMGMTAADMPDKGDTIVGHDVWIGRDATIMPGVKIGNGAVIGSKAVVAKDIPDYAIAVGNPARVIKYRFDEETIAFLQDLEWWNFSEEELDEAMPYLTSVDLPASKQALAEIKAK